MLNYKLSARQNPSDREAASKVYASVVSSGHLTMEMICANIDRNSTATRGDVKGVALAFANGIAKSLANGNSVYLEDLGFFRFGIKSQGSETEKTVTAANITDKYINFQPKGKIAESRSTVPYNRVGQKTIKA